MKKVVIAVLLHLLLVLRDVELSESNDNKTSEVESTTASAKQLKVESTTLPTINENSTISIVDKNVATNVTEATTAEPTTTTTDPEQMLIPPAKVEAQIVNADVTTRKPSRLQAAQ